MTPHKILCPVDFSPCSHVALEHAVQLARCYDAELVIAHVCAPPPTYAAGYAGYGYLPPYEPEPDPRLDKIDVADPSVKFSRVHLVGVEGEAILHHAEESDCDLIVMGTHGHRGFTKLLLGSVADHVLRHAKCPVIVVKDRTAEAIEAEDVVKSTETEDA